MSYWINKMLHCKTYKGMVLILCMVFLAVVSAFAVAICSMSGTSVQIASNHHKANVAFANAESGLEVIRYWLNRILIPSTTTPSDYFTTVIHPLQYDLTINSISNILVHSNGLIPPVTLDAAADNTFSAQIQTHPSNPSILVVSVTGNHGQVSRTIQTNFDIEPRKPPIFDYGISTKGPILFDGNPTIEGVNYNNEADIYIESQNDLLALQVNGNTNFDGNINIVNEMGEVYLGGDILIGGDQGQTAVDNHVFIGVDPVEFPLPNTGHFRQYATGSSINSLTDTSGNMTLSNAVIEAGTNPCFEGNVTIKGVLFIESPNKVQFDGNVDIKGLIIGDGDVNNPGTNDITFNGNFQSGTFPAGHAFDNIRSETGSSLLAPGFKVELAGNFATLGGVMAVSGFHLSGNANALVRGSIVNYSESSIVVAGNATLRFDRSNNTDTPAGFDEYRILEYDASSWSMIH